MPSNFTLLQLEPDTTLHFYKTPSTSSPNRMLKLTNLHHTNVAFKVKTTAPKAYLVRPSSGTLRPRETQEVQIILQPQGAEYQANNHRFLVQATQAASTEPVSREQWAEFPKESIQEQRLNVVLEELQAEPAMVTKQPAEAPTVSNLAPPPTATTTAAGGGPPGNAMAPTAAGAEEPAELKVKYDELVQYTLCLEKEKKKLENEFANLQAMKGASSGDGGFSSFQILLIVAVLVLLVAYLAKSFG